MDQSDIYDLLGSTIYHRAEQYVDRVNKFCYEPRKSGGRHITARVHGSGRHIYNVEIFLDSDGSYSSGSCDCPYNACGDGYECKHIGAVLLFNLQLAEEDKRPALSPDKIPGVVRGADLIRGGSYASSLKMMFGSKWHESEPVSDASARDLLRYYQENALSGVTASTGDLGVRPGSVALQPILHLYSGDPPWLRLRISDGGRPYVVKNTRSFLLSIARGETVSYGKALSFVHRREAFTPEALRLIDLLRRMLNNQQGFNYISIGVQGGIPLAGATFDELVAMYEDTGVVGSYTLLEGLPSMTMQVKKKSGGVQISLTPPLGWFSGFNYDYIFSVDELQLWRLSRKESAHFLPALRTLCGSGTFFTTKDASAFCSFVLPELGAKIKIDDPKRLLLNQIPPDAVVQFYLDAPRSDTVSAHAEFVYGEDRVTPFAAPAGLVRNARAEARAAHLLQAYLTPGEGGNAAVYSTDDEDAVFRFLDEGIPALFAEGEVYLSDAFRRMQATPPKISVGVSVHGSVLDLDVDTGGFPLEELRELMKSVHQKKRYHRLRDGSLLKIDASMDVLDELNETLELSGAKLGQAHAQLPLYRAPSLDRALSGQDGVYFNRDDAFRRISRSFHAIKDSEYTVPESLQNVLRKYQRDGYRWLRTLDGYGMGGILADDMGLGKTLQVLTYLLARKEAEPADPDTKHLPSLIVCPASLVLNWSEECQKFTPSLRCVAVDGSAARRAELAAQWAEADLVVTSYDLLRRDKSLYEKREFYACILDEAQAVKNHTTQKYKAVCCIRSHVRFALTGTPVENRLGELWSIFSFLMPGYLPPYKSFCTRFEKPIALENDENATRRLNQLTGPFILRRMKSEVLKELPPKTESVYRIELETEQRKLYLAAVVDARDKLRAAKPEDKMAVFAVLMRLREICCDPRLVVEGWQGRSAKLDACMDLVGSAVEGGHRILLFSQFTSMLALLAERLDAEGISHFTLQGSTPKTERAELVRRFNGGEASVFLISLRAGGTGLNLTAADIVIHYDPWWNVAAQNQATDRAYRIGQQNPVQVYKLIAQDTIEEKIVELQQAKQFLAETVTGSADGAILSMKPEDLLALLEEE